jgi:hypothetical protein
MILRFEKLYMLEQIQSWYREAVDLHGDDWSKIELYVANKLETVSATDRAQLAAEFNTFRVCLSDTLN